MESDLFHEQGETEDNSVTAALIAGFITGVIAAIGIGKLFFTKG